MHVSEPFCKSKAPKHSPYPGRTVEGIHHTILSALREGVFFVDADATIVYANPYLAGLLGYSEHELTGRSLLDLLDLHNGPIDPAQFAQYCMAIQDVARLPLIRSDGTRRLTLVSLSPVFTDEHFSGAAGIVQDVDLLQNAGIASPCVALRRDTIEQTRHGARRASYGRIIGQSSRMQEIYRLIDAVAASDSTVLITGESGTGKELVAQAIHKQSLRRDGPFVVAHCAAYTEALLGSELFGHERGAFTGATHQKKGRIERAHRGTLFLDEIGDISSATQVLLLRLLQDRSFERVGGEQVMEGDVRILAATNRDLQGEIQAGRFRQDLYYRLNVVSIHMPPLRERKEDVPLLAHHFLKYAMEKEGKSFDSFSPDALQALSEYSWPGNVRQLENAISHAVIVARGTVLGKDDLPTELAPPSLQAAFGTLAGNERILILRMLQETRWNIHKAAQKLQVSRSTLYSKMRRYGIERQPKSA